MNFLKKYKDKLIDIALCLLSSLAVFIVFAIIFSKNNIYPFGEKSIAWCDLKQQGIPLLMNFKDVLSGNGSVLYSFNNAAGMNFWGVFLFFLSNPFSFLCVFFDKTELYLLVNTLTILKLCTSAFTASFFFIKTSKNLFRPFVVPLGISYTLCGYGLMYFQNIMWLDVMYLYPLLALGIYNVVKQKGYGLYAVSLALCVIFNFYLSFMVVVTVLIAIGLYILITKDELSNKRKAVMNFFTGSVIAALSSSVSWLPAFIQYSSSGRGKSVIDTLKGSALGTTHNTILLLVLSSAFIVIGIISLLKPNRRVVSTFIAFVLFAIPIFVEPINKMWHMGSYMSFPARYAFITIFTGLNLVAFALEKEPEKEPSTKKANPSDKNISSEKSKNPYDLAFNIVSNVVFIIAGIITVYCLINKVCINLFDENRETLSAFTKTLWGDEAQLDVTIKVAKIFSIIYFVYAIFYKFNLLNKKVFSVLLTFVVLCEGAFAIKAYNVTVIDRNIFNSYNDFYDLENKIDDESFYRVKTDKKYLDSNLLGALGYNSIGHYTSLTNEEYMNAYKSLGYSSSWMELSTYGGTELSDAILGVKYEILKRKIDNSVYTNGKYSIINTFSSLGLGVKYSGINDVFNPKDQSRIDFQEKIFSSLFQSNETLFEKYSPSEFKNCSLTEKDGIFNINGKGDIIYNIRVNEEQTLYFDAFAEFSNSLRQPMDKGFTVYVNDKKITDFPNGMYTGLVKLGTFKNQDVTVKLVTKKQKMNLISFGVAGLKRDLLKNAVLKTESGYIQGEGNKAFGNVNGKDGEYLFVAIPYDKGFKVTVNGKEVETEKVFGDFYSIPLSNGENYIEMKYTPPGFTIGLIISILGILLAVVIFVFKKNNLINKTPLLNKLSCDLNCSDCDITKNNDSETNSLKSSKSKKEKQKNIETSVEKNISKKDRIFIKTSFIMNVLYIIAFIAVIFTIYLFPFIARNFM